MDGHGGCSADSSLSDSTSPIPSHCASIVATSILRVNFISGVMYLNSVIFTVFSIEYRQSILMRTARTCRWAHDTTGLCSWISVQIHLSYSNIYYHTHCLCSMYCYNVSTKHILPYSLSVFHVLLQCVHKTYTTIFTVCVPCIVTMCPQNIYYHTHCLCSMYCYNVSENIYYHTHCLCLLYCYNVSTKHILPYSLSVFHVLLQCVPKHILPYSLSVFHHVLLKCVHKTYTTILTVCVPSIVTMCPQNIYYHTHCWCSMYCYNVSTKHILPYSLSVFHVLLQCVPKHILPYSLSVFHVLLCVILTVCVPCIVTMCPQKYTTIHTVCVSCIVTMCLHNIYYHTHCLCSMYCYNVSQNIYYHTHCLCSMYCYNVSTKHILPYSLSMFHVLLQCVHKTYTNILTVCVPSIATMCPQNIYYHTHCLCSMYCYNVSTKHILPYSLSVFHLLLQCVHTTYTTILTVGVPCIVTMCPQNIYYHTLCLCSMYRSYNVLYSLSVFHVLLQCVHKTYTTILTVCVPCIVTLCPRHTAGHWGKQVIYTPGIDHVVVYSHEKNTHVHSNPCLQKYQTKSQSNKPTSSEQRD